MEELETVIYVASTTHLEPLVLLLHFSLVLTIDAKVPINSHNKHITIASITIKTSMLMYTQYFSIY